MTHIYSQMSHILIWIIHIHIFHINMTHIYSQMSHILRWIMYIFFSILIWLISLRRCHVCVTCYMPPYHTDRHTYQLCNVCDMKCVCTSHVTVIRILCVTCYMPPYHTHRHTYDRVPRTSHVPRSSHVPRTSHVPHTSHINMCDTNRVFSSHVTCERLICVTCYMPHITHTLTHTQAYIPPAPMNHVNIFKGWPPRDATSKLVQLWYKKFPPDQRGLVEMKLN